MNPASYAPTSSFVLPLSPLDNMSFARPFASELARAYSRWMSPAPHGSYISGSPAVAAAEREIDWADPRIQRWNGPEREENGAYLEKAEDVHKVFAAMEVSGGGGGGGGARGGAVLPGRARDVGPREA